MIQKNKQTYHRKILKIETEVNLWKKMNFEDPETGISYSRRSWLPIAPEHLTRLDDVKAILSQNVPSREKRSSEQKFYQVDISVKSYSKVSSINDNLLVSFTTVLNRFHERSQIGFQICLP